MFENNISNITEMFEYFNNQTHIVLVDTNMKKNVFKFRILSDFENIFINIEHTEYFIKCSM